jgi:CheY-like chemotaxis protein
MRNKIVKKLKILIADDEEMLRDLYEMIIETEFSCETTKVSSGSEAINVLKNDPHFDIILSDYNMPEGNGGKIYLFNKTQNNIPFFLFSGGELRDYSEFKDFNEANLLNHFFNKPFAEGEIIKAISKITQDSVESSTGNDEQYIKVKLSYYALHTKTPAEVYIKLNDNKYTKIINANEGNIPDVDLLEHYLKKGIDFIYIERDYFKNFLDDVFNKFQQDLRGEKKQKAIIKFADLIFIRASRA